MTTEVTMGQFLGMADGRKKKLVFDIQKENIIHIWINICGFDVKRSGFNFQLPFCGSSASTCLQEGIFWGTSDCDKTENQIIISYLPTIQKDVLQTKPSPNNSLLVQSHHLHKQVQCRVSK